MNSYVRRRIKYYQNKFPSVKKLKVQESDLPTHRLMAMFIMGGKERIVHFGYRARNGTTALTYSDDQSLVEKRNAYRARASKIKNKQGKNTYLIPGSKNSFAYFLLW